MLVLQRIQKPVDVGLFGRSQSKEAVAHDFALAAVRDDRVVQGSGAAVVQIARAQPQPDQRCVRQSRPVASPCTILSSSAGPMSCSNRSE